MIQIQIVGKLYNFQKTGVDLEIRAGTSHNGLASSGE